VEKARAIVLAGTDIKRLEEDMKKGGNGLWQEVRM
jgi:hypothetical protein